jgi:PXPV repeat (3 copies)
MTTAKLANRSILISGASAVLAVAAMAFSGTAAARSDVSFSIGVGLPGVQVDVGNAYPVYGGYPQPVYVQPAPVYVQPPPVYYQPRPVYVRPAPVYVQPAPIYYNRPYLGWQGRGHGHGRDRGYDGRDGRDGRGGYERSNGYYAPPAPLPHGYYQRPGYGPVYYQR